MPGAAPLLLRQHLTACVLTTLYLLAWAALANAHGHPFATLADPPIAATEQALLEVQRHPEEGIHALARVQLPPYTGILHLTHAGLWCAALALALRLPTRPVLRIALAAFPLALAQEAFLLSAERLGHETLWHLAYLLFFVLALVAARRVGLFPTLVLTTPWLLLRLCADLLPSAPLVALTAETFAGLCAPLLWCLALAGASAQSAPAAKE